jgi:hypothetical protein
MLVKDPADIATKIELVQFCPGDAGYPKLLGAMFQFKLPPAPAVPLIR